MMYLAKLRRYAPEVSEHLPAPLRTLLNSYAEVFFLSGPTVGLVLMVASFSQPNVGLCGLLAAISAYSFACLIGYRNEFLNAGYHTYNALLLGFAIGFLFQLDAVTLVLLWAAGCFCFTLTLALGHGFYTFFRLPILSLPFALVALMVHLSAWRFAGLTAWVAPEVHLEPDWLPLWLVSYFKALGTVFFNPSLLMGAVIALLILLRSRILFAVGFLGFHWGCAVQALFMGDWHAALLSPTSFNYALVAMALAAVYNIPCARTYGITAAANTMTALIIGAASAWLGWFYLPIFTLPFALVTLAMLYLLGLVQYPFRPSLFKGSPEKTLDHFLAYRHNLAPTFAVINLPFAGCWQVWQGFDGRWTHQGIWRHAYDFVITDAESKTHCNQGLELHDYYCFKQPVYAPSRGRIVECINHLPDNPIGTLDSHNNWGNWLIIEDPRGFYVEISHFAQNSLAVKAGDWVEVGHYLGQCGNSGYSPQPHIHIQVQPSSWIHSGTIPFRFANYLIGNHYHSFGLPPEHSQVQQVVFQPYYDQATTFLLDSHHHYQIFDNNKKVGDWHLTVGMASDSTLYFRSEQGTLYFSKYAGEFRLLHCEGRDPYLNMLYLAAPLVPMFYTAEQTWKVRLNSAAATPKKTALIGLVNAFSSDWLATYGEYQFISEQEIAGVVRCERLGVEHKTYVKIQANSGFAVVRFNQYEIRRVE